MDKKLIKVLIVIWSIIAIGFTGLLIYGIANGGRINNMFKSFRFSYNSTLTVQKEESIDISDLSKLNIDFSSSDILVESTDESNIKVIQKASKDLDDDEKFVVTKKDDEVTIKKDEFYHKFNLFNLGNSNQRIEVYIPKNYTKDLNVNSSSGNIKCNLDATLNNVSCKASSGNISIGSKINVNDVDLKASSGNVEVESLTSNKYNIDSASGNVNIEAIAGSGEIKSSSGNVKVSYKGIDEYSEVSATSGNIHIEVPTELNFEFNGECTSGDIKSNFDLNYKDKSRNSATAQIGNAPYKKLNASTSAGNINIEK